jgi:hypothetical protein
MAFTFEGDEVEHLTAVVIKVTERALLAHLPEHDKEEWFPLSQISDESTVDEESGSRGVLTVASWVAKEKGLT